jgi:hypothetical protein
MSSEQPESRLAAAQQIAQELRVDPDHRGTMRLAEALGDAADAPAAAEPGASPVVPVVPPLESRTVLATIMPSPDAAPPLVHVPARGRCASKRR